MEHELLWWSRMAAPLVVITVASAAIIVLWLRYSPPLWWVMWRVRRARPGEVSDGFDSGQMAYYALGDIHASEHWFLGRTTWTISMRGRSWEHSVRDNGSDPKGRKAIKAAYERLGGLYEMRQREAAEADQQHAYELRWRLNT